MRVLLVVILASLLSALLVSLTLTARSYMRTRIVALETLQVQAAMIAVHAAAPLQFDDREAAQETLRAMGAVPDAGGAVLYDDNGREFARWTKGATEGLDLSLGNAGQEVQDHWLLVQIPVEHQGDYAGSLVMAIDLSPRYQRVRESLAWALAAAGGASVVALLIGLQMQRSVARPVEELARTAERISTTRDFSVRASKYSDDEFGQLTETFNQMLTEIQRQSDEIEDRQKQFRLAVEAAPNAMVMVDDLGVIMLVNTQAERLFGYSRDELVGQSVEVLVPERLRGRHPDYRTAFFTSPRARPMGAGRDLFGRRKDGTEIPVEIGLNPIQTDEGLRVLSSIVDITERRQQQEELRLSQERLALAQAAGHVGTFDWNLMTGQVFWTPELETLFGIEPGTFEGTFEQWSQHIHADDRAAAMHTVQQAVEHRRELRNEYRIIRPDGEIRWMMAMGETLADSQGNPVRMIGVNVDITDRKQAEENSARLAAIVNYSHDSIIGKTLDGIITSFNPGAERMYGYKAEEIIGKPIAMLFPPEYVDQELPQIMERLKRNEVVQSYETMRRRKDGSTLPVSVTVSPTRAPDGRLIGASSIARDITDQKRAEAERSELLESERAARAEAERASRMKDEFVATLSHELRTPLTAILGWAQMLRKIPDQPPQVEQGLEIIERNARVQTRIIEDLLDISRIVSGKIRLDVQQVDLSQVIEAALATVRPAAEARGIRLQTVVDPHVGPVRGDPNRLQQVVWNLLSNAIKFTDRGGRVQVCLERVNSHVEISVSDSGIGISPDFLPYVFQRFRQADSSTTRQHGGLGLGLAIVRQLVELHGGSVRAKSPGVGQGATFIIALPLMAVHPPEEDPENRLHPRMPKALSLESESVSLDGIRVLVVDDEPDARELVARLLVDRGAEVAKASSAMEALRLVEPFKPHVLVSDIGMPQQDGYDLIRQLRALPASSGGNIAAVALTAFARSEDRTRALMAGYQMHVSKPVEPSELMATVASLAGRAAHPGPENPAS